MAAAIFAGGSVENLHAQTVLDIGHVDIALGYQDTQWNFTVQDKANNVSYAPGAAVLGVNASSQQVIPADPAYSFLGSAGSSYYLLPQTQAAGSLFLGVNGEAVPNNQFEGDVFSVYLRSVSGPGNFSMFTTDGSGNVTVLMNSGDGLSGEDHIEMPTTSHLHGNWAFSAPGVYTIGLEAYSFDLGQGNVTSPTVNFTVQVVPEPGTWALLGAGGLALIGLRKRK